MNSSDLLKANLAKMAKAKPAHTSQSLATDGRYLLEVQSMKYAADTHKGDFSIAQLKVLSSTPTKPGATPSTVGSIVDYMENTTNKDSNGGGRFNTFLLTLVQEDDQSKVQNLDWLVKFFDESQAGAYCVIEAETFTGEIKGGTNKGNPITKVKFKRAEMTPELYAEIEKKRAAAKLPAFSSVF